MRGRNIFVGNTLTADYYTLAPLDGNSALAQYVTVDQRLGLQLTFTVYIAVFGKGHCDISVAD